jgi:hypothetical protein
MADKRIDMEIIDTRHVTPDLYTIEGIHVTYDWSQRPRYISPTLVISLKPEGYMRSRFSEGGASYETKKHGARQLRITSHELQQLVAAFADEVDLCHEVLLNHKLIPDLAELRRKRQQPNGDES